MKPCSKCGRVMVEYLTESREEFWVALNALVEKLGRKPTYAELGEELNITPESAWKRGKWFIEHGWLEWDHDHFAILKDI